MEKKLKIKTPDNHLIYGTLNSNKLKNSKLIIFVHGLSGNQNEHQFFNAVPFFTNKGFDVFRFDFYSDEDRARQLSECSIKIHAKDLSLVIDYFKKIYKKLFLVGHSLGASVILRTDLTPVSRLVLWDPTKGMRSLKEKDCVYDKKSDKYILRWGVEIIIGEDMINDWKEASNLKMQIKKISKPCKFIFAGNNNIYKAWRPFLKSMDISFEYAVIKGASHVFVEEGAEQKLFKETLKWLKL